MHDLRQALSDATTSLETIASLAGRKTFGDPPIATHMDTFQGVRSYAAARAEVARQEAETPDGLVMAMVKLSRALGDPKTVQAREGQCVEAVLIEMAAEALASRARSDTAGVNTPDGEQHG